MKIDTPKHKDAFSNFPTSDDNPPAIQTMPKIATATSFASSKVFSKIRVRELANSEVPKLNRISDIVLFLSIILF